MKLSAVVVALILFLVVRLRSKGHLSLSGFAGVYFAIATIAGGITVILKCLLHPEKPLQVDESEVILILFGTVAMVWVSIREVMRHLDDDDPPRAS